MCNPRTKLECYQYRVFGLPWGKKEVVEEIKPGAKLFLYDFELKLLYGIYEATSAGNLNLEPAAFRGRFPAQECLPLPENSLRHVIKENYTGLKFKQELSGKQVKKLMLSFHPLGASSCQPAALANVSLSQAVPPSAMENQFKHTGRLPMMEVPYLYVMQYRQIQQLAKPQPVPKVNYLQHVYHGRAAYAEHRYPTLDHRSLPATSSYYVPSSHRPSFTEGAAHEVQEPTYSRTIEERAPYAQVTSLGRYMTMQQKASHDEVSILERQYHQLPPLQREALYQNNVAAYNSNPIATAQYTSSVLQTQVPAPPHPLPLQIGAQYQNSEVPYSSNPAAQVRYTASVSQPQIPPSYLPLEREAFCRDNVAAYNSNPTIPSVMQPQVLAYRIYQGSDPITCCYSYSAAH